MYTALPDTSDTNTPAVIGTEQVCAYVNHLLPLTDLCLGCQRIRRLTPQQNKGRGDSPCLPLVRSATGAQGTKRTVGTRSLPWCRLDHGSSGIQAVTKGCQSF